MKILVEEVKNEKEQEAEESGSAEDEELQLTPPRTTKNNLKADEGEASASKVTFSEVNSRSKDTNKIIYIFCGMIDIDATKNMTKR